MPKYVAFLRAINVGGHNVKMDQLRQLFEALGFAQVETFIASGNVIFDSTSKSVRDLEVQIEDHLHAKLGYKVATFIRSTTELADIAHYEPFPDSDLNTEGGILYIGFMAGKPSEKAIQKLLSLSTDIDDFHLNGREVYWQCRTRFSDSKFSGPLLEKTLGIPATLRNSTTVKKIAAKYA